MNSSSLIVACLCARWCGVCREYGSVFEALSTEFAGSAKFTWLDIEDEAEFLDDVEVENFPTMLIARGGKTLFFGPITPQAATLGRLVQGALHGDLPRPSPDADIDALSARLSQRPADSDRTDEIPL